MIVNRVLKALGRTPAPVVPVIRLSGVISAGGGLRPGIHLAALAGAIERAFAVPDRPAVALAINSPGGSPVQSALVAGRIRQLAEEKGVPVLAFCEDVAASGGYWLACAADEIWADPSSIVGSIGVVSAGFGFHALIDRWGIERRVHTAGERKALLDPFRPEDPEDVVRLKRIQVEIHDQFKDMVRRRRGGRLRAEESEIFTGDVWTGRRALELGLVDGLGDLRTVLRGRFGDKIRLRAVPTERRWLPRGLRLMGPGSGRGGGLIGADRLGDWAAEVGHGVVAAAEERALWARYGL
ncbi:S49 family peptidase [Arenibaculum pallidiluteum]|uniref:S49 family peptidase n=1 Tax=Arenibaculum pallidiluteum TaxID=2812559 RepID=UPI001A975942|nr:S49 family peptidase [Arenibaculum pallidiluteum]